MFGGKLSPICETQNLLWCVKYKYVEKMKMFFSSVHQEEPFEMERQSMCDILYTDAPSSYKDNFLNIKDFELVLGC